jgi:hypothetical protein
MTGRLARYGERKEPQSKRAGKLPALAKKIYIGKEFLTCLDRIRRKRAEYARKCKVCRYCRQTHGFFVMNR